MTTKYKGSFIIQFSGHGFKLLPELFLFIQILPHLPRTIEDHRLNLKKHSKEV
jgi:hypothetical protein